MLLLPHLSPSEDCRPRGTGARCAWLSRGEHPVPAASLASGRDEWVKGDPQDGLFSSPPPCVSSPLMRVFFNLSLVGVVSLWWEV